MTCDAWLDADRLISTATPATTWLGRILRALLGGESAPAGSTIQTGSSASSLIAAAGHGSRFPVGQVFLADVGGVPEVVISRAVSGDTITPLFNLSAAPTAGQRLINCHNYFLTDQNSQSLTIQHALAQDNEHQWTVNGCTGSLSIDLARDSRLSYAFDLQGARWVGPSAQSLTVSAGANALVGPVANVSAVCLLQSLTTSTRIHVPFHSLSLSIEPGNQHVQELGGAIEGTVGVMRAAAPSVTATLTIRADLDQYSLWSDDEDLVLVYAIPVGTGTNRRWTGFVLYCTREERPARAEEGIREMTQLSLRSRHNVMQSAVQTDLALSPFVIFEG